MTERLCLLCGKPLVPTAHRNRLRHAVCSRLAELFADRERMRAQKREQGVREQLGAKESAA